MLRGEHLGDGVVVRGGEDHPVVRHDVTVRQPIDEPVRDEDGVDRAQVLRDGVDDLGRVVREAEPDVRCALGASAVTAGPRVTNA